MSVYERKEIERIREQYLEKENETSDIEKLRDLDAKVKNPPVIVSFIIGIFGSLVLGTGMCLAMKIIGSNDLHMILGIIIGIIGIVVVSINYPLYKKILNSRKAKYVKEILELTEKILEK